MLNSNVAISYNPKISYDKSSVKRMLSDAFYMLELDQRHYGVPEWNPLGEYVHPGDKVIIKPNLVFHNNLSGEGIECLYTQASVIEAIIEFVCTALEGKGSIVVGDAPMQGCQFDKLIEESGYKTLIEEYRKRGIDIELRDFRNTISEIHKGIVMEKGLQQNNSVIVDLSEELSSFAGLSEECIKNMRVTNYDSGILQSHHTLRKHEYLIAKEILDADVVINVPKPKTHRKAGVTGALKNLVGINNSKEYLPHHTRQSAEVQGDAFLHKDIFLRLADEYEDKKCRAEKRRHYMYAYMYKYMVAVCLVIGRKRTHEKYSEGSWYGNDTIWRTILDLNKILQYADKNGTICSERQRRFFNIGDMIVSGENDGPVRPSRKETGVIIAGGDPCSFDEVVTALMGFEANKIPTIRNMRLARPQIYLNEDYHIISNREDWNGKKVSDIYKYYNLGFQANPGWREVLK